MSMLIAPICLTNEGPLERGILYGPHRYSINRITVKMSNGKRYRRYAVCVDGCWHSNQRMTLREARAHVEALIEEYKSAEYYAMNI